ncbi:hypothetical protein HD806DRAFT_331311 [Xylariaceae sp. AK1471]|nr:hypothetical protein HD806DRAFT_331311 [Xylariaceae sp. AK1471]
MTGGEPTTRQCITCLEDKPNQDYITATPSCERKHNPDVCTQCARTWIRSIIENGDTQVVCPQCRSVLTYLEIQVLTDKATFQRYEGLLVSRHLTADPTFVWCAHACGSGQSHPGGVSEPIMSCHHCEGKRCVVHQLPWHSGSTCQQFDESLSLGHQDPKPEQSSKELKSEEELLAIKQRARDDKLSRDAARLGGKRCPNCRFYIHKIDGW